MLKQSEPACGSRALIFLETSVVKRSNEMLCRNMMAHV